MTNNPTPREDTALTSSPSLKAVPAGASPTQGSGASSSSYFAAVSTNAPSRDATSESNRRNSYRCPCNLTCSMEAEIHIRDVSLGGAALMLTYSIPAGTPLTLNLPTQDTLLHGLKSHVVSSGIGPTKGSFEIHLKFVAYPLNVQRSMVRFLMETQVKKTRH